MILLGFVKIREVSSLQARTYLNFPLRPLYFIALAKTALNTICIQFFI